MSTPNRDYYMPPEANPHLRTLLAWPDITSNPESVGFVKPDDLELARQEIASIANSIAKFEPVWLYAKPANIESAVASVLSTVTVKPLAVDQLWIRDTGPIFVSTSDGRLAGTDTNFNYWGGKFSVANGEDPSVAQRILKQENVLRTQAPFVSEGGALEFDGEGTMLVTESSLLNSNRNPKKNKSQLEEELRTMFGVQKVIWLRGAKGIDSTDYHVDALARFGPNGTVLLSRPNDSVPRDHVQYRCYLQAKSVLESATNAVGRPLNIVEVEEARTVPRAEEGGVNFDELPCLSYVNYYLANGAVIVPVFGDAKPDLNALQVIREVWSAREIVPVKLNWMAWAGGGVHCATQQWPQMSTQQGDT